MPRHFSRATAEQVVAVVEAVVVYAKPTTKDFVRDFADLTEAQSEAALELAADLKLLTRHGGDYILGSPLCRFIANSDQAGKAVALRIVLEDYEPFAIFRQRLMATQSPSIAAQQTKVVLDLDAHREDINHTLVSLGTYCQALANEGSGRYRPEAEPTGDTLQVLAEGCQDLEAAELRVREQLGNTAAERVSRDDVIRPLARGLREAISGRGQGAVVSAGNAVESFLAEVANRRGVNIVGANGINAKLDRLDTAGHLPKKLVFFGKYLGHIRNAADHGVDNDIGASWIVRDATGLEYVFVACSFVSVVITHESGGPFEI